MRLERSGRIVGTVAGNGTNLMNIHDTYAADPSRPAHFTRPFRLAAGRLIIDSKGLEVAIARGPDALAPVERDDNAHALVCLLNAAPKSAGNVADATPAGEVPGIAGQWLPAARCAQLAPLLHALLDNDADHGAAGLAVSDAHALRILADDLECGSRDPNVSPEPGDELPLSALRLPSTYPRGLELVIDSQDVQALVASLSDDEVGYAGLPMVDEISGALVRSEDGEHVEVWLTYSTRPFDTTVARYTCVLAP